MNKKKEDIVLCDVPLTVYPVIVGRICSPYGILGWLKIISFTETFDNLMEYQPWYVKIFSGWSVFYLETWRKYSGNSCFIVKFKKIYNRDMALLLRNHDIFVDVCKFPILGSGEYYCKDILGCRVIGITGYQFGLVVDLIQTGSNDVLVVKNEKHFVRHFFLIPVITHVMKDIDCLNRIINVDWDPTF